MKLSDVYNQINILLSESSLHRESFKLAAEKVDNQDDEMEYKLILKSVFDSFSDPFSSSSNSIQPHVISINDLNLRNIGREAVVFSASKHFHEYYLLKETSKDKLTEILNEYSPEPLDVEMIFFSLYDVTVIIKLRGLK